MKQHLLTKDILVGADLLPLVKRVGCEEVGLDYVNSQNRKHEYESRNHRADEESSLGVRGLVLAVEGVGAAGDSAGKTLVVALLHHNGNDDDKCRYEKCR